MTNTNCIFKNTEQKPDFANGDKILKRGFKYLSIDKNTNEGKNYRNNVVKSTFGTSKSRINTGFPENISVLSPMMREYCKTKENYKDCILFYRLGDFYEMFFV